MTSSILEKNNAMRQELEMGFALAVVESVNVANRTCSLRTYSGSTGHDNNTFDLAQWISLDATSEGDETAAIPRRGATVLVAVVQGQAYILGGIRPLNKEGGIIYGNELPVSTGDKIIKTKAGNRITVRANKLIEVISREGALQSIYRPDDGSISHLCNIHKMVLKGGRTEWTYDPILLSAVKKEIVKKDLFQSMVVVEQKGNVDELTVYKKEIGTLPPGLTDIPLPIFKETIDMFGTRKVSIQPNIGIGGIEIQQDGIGPLWSIKMGLLPQIKLDVNGLLGTVDLDVNKIIQVSLSGIDGTMKINNKLASAEISGTGDITVKNPTVEVTLGTLGDVALKNPTVELTISKTGDIGLKNPLVETKIGVDGSLSVENSSAYKIAASPAGEVSVSNTGKAGMKLSPAGQVAFGGASAELLDLFDKTFDALDELLTSMGTETHIGNMGLPTTLGPDAVINYKKSQVKLKALKTQLGTIKGSL